MIGEDLTPFYVEGEFAVPVLRRRASVPDVAFSGILTTTDEEALQGYAITADHRLSYPTGSIDLVSGDEVVVNGETFLVRRTDRVNDGLETEAVISKVS